MRHMGNQVMACPLLIIVPTLDSHHLLPRLLESLQQQSWSQWRLLFVDGPSGLEHRNWLRRVCEIDRRCSWVIQDRDKPGIFGAMNQGFALAGPSDWLLFWGSDDWASERTVLAKLTNQLESKASKEMVPDLLVCCARYVNAVSNTLGRASKFGHPGILDCVAYHRALFFGSTPPHQATLFSPRARRHLACYTSGFRLSADLDYFLQLSRYPGLRVQCLDLELVHIASGGVSGQQTLRRLMEVRRAYHHTFGWRWWFPFLMRYLRRMASLLDWSR